ncbi:MAG TPA: hypothetical protein VNA25_27435 [Phycisphaerae bacterium]|nr:hypothetical protein [Phycisphaerae bacterium]
MRYGAFVLLALSALALAEQATTQPGQAADPNTADANEPMLLLSGKRFLVHLLPQRTPTGQPSQSTRWALRQRGDPGPGGVMLLHTALPSGKMTVLLSTGSRAWVDTLSHAMRTEFRETRLGGVLLDGNNLYALSWTRTDPRQATVGWSLYVFDVNSGALLEWATIEGGRIRLQTTTEGTRYIVAQFDPPPETQRRDVWGPGPLKRSDGGVMCFGVIFRIADGKVTAERPPPATQPAAGAPGSKSITP